MHVCKLFNDDRGCAADEKDCPLKARHVCDVRLSSQSACAGDHPRKQCPRAVRWGQHPAVAFTKVTAVAFLDRNDRLSPSLPQGREARLRYVVNSNVPDWEPLQLCDGRLLGVVIDLCSGFGSLLHVLLALGCRCVAVCVEHNKEFAEVAQAAFPAISALGVR